MPHALRRLRAALLGVDDPAGLSLDALLPRGAGDLKIVRRGAGELGEAGGESLVGEVLIAVADVLLDGVSGRDERAEVGLLLDDAGIVGSVAVLRHAVDQAG